MKHDETISIRHLTPNYDKLLESIAKNEETEWEGRCWIGQDAFAADLDMVLRGKKQHLYIITDENGKQTAGCRDLIERMSRQDAPRTGEYWYLPNCLQPLYPGAIELPAGEGERWKQGLQRWQKEFVRNLMRQLDSAPYLLQESQIKEKHKEKGEKAVEALRQEAAKQGFEAYLTDKEMYFIPVMDGEKLKEEEYEALEETEKLEIVEKSNALQVKAAGVLALLRQCQADTEDEMISRRKTVVHIMLSESMEKLDESWEHRQEILAYHRQMRQSMEETLDEWFDEAVAGEPGKVPLYFQRWLPYAAAPAQDRFPIVWASMPTAARLMGRIAQKDPGNDSSLADIQPGLLQEANGGILLVDARELFSSAGAWNYLKSCIEKKEIFHQDIKEESYSLFGERLQIQPIPFHVQLVLCGSFDLYQLLCKLDEDFAEIFSEVLYFPARVAKNDESLIQWASYLRWHSRTRGFRDADWEAVKILLRHIQRRFAEGGELPAYLGCVDSILYECYLECEKHGWTTLSAETVRTVLRQMDRRRGKIAEQFFQEAASGKYLLEASGERVGTINGLAVTDLGHFRFGKPVRITASVFQGKPSMISLEESSGLSGAIYNKGIGILRGYLGWRYGCPDLGNWQVSLCFEQSYGLVEGDSAVLSQAYGILSALSKAPIEQGIGVTGSMDQFGRIQPVGGINDKIEGFYQFCQTKGQEDSQGVIFPRHNLQDLCLEEEVVRAVEEERFHLYPIDTLEEGIPILMGMDAERFGKRLKQALHKR